jgi:hypothetical protein
MAWLHAQASAVLDGPFLPMALISGTQILHQQPLVVFSGNRTCFTGFPTRLRIHFSFTNPHGIAKFSHSPHFLIFP